MKPTLLIVDAEESSRDSLQLILEEEYDLVFAEDAKSTLRILKSTAFNLCLLDLMLPDDSGIDLLRQIKRRDESLEVIMVTALQNVDTALEAMKLGACDYISKPFQVNELLEIIKRVLNKRAIERENRFLKGECFSQTPVSLIGNSKVIREVLRRIKEIAMADAPVLIRGEMGSGNEDVAQEIHRQSQRQNESFVVIPCGALSRGQLNVELFGQEGDEEKNKSAQIGKLEFAEKGTLYLEKVERLPLETQGEMTKIFLERKLNRGNGPMAISLDFRVIASCEVDLIPEVEAGRFRKDFYQFLSSYSILVPPLRDRREDIPGLIDHFLKVANQKAKIPVKNIHKDAVRFLTGYNWPGNLTELQNSIEMMTIFAGKDNLALEDIPLDILVKQIDLAKTKAEAKISLRRVRRQFERQYIRKVLERTRGNQTRTAATLGLHRNTLIWKLKELNLEEDYKKIVKKRREGGIGFRDL